MMKGEEVVRKIKEFVKEQCYKPEAKYGSEIFENHLVPMRNYAVDLAEDLGADKEIVEISAWLHDIGSVMIGRKDHHITGSKIAEEELIKLDYPKEKIEQVKHCILSHRGSQNNFPETVEARIISDADALSNFENLPGIFKAAYVYENQTQLEARKSTMKKLEKKWNKLTLPRSKTIIKPKYEAAKLLLE